jgi:hypothetical protein
MIIWLIVLTLVVAYQMTEIKWLRRELQALETWEPFVNIARIGDAMNEMKEEEKQKKKHGKRSY